MFFCLNIQWWKENQSFWIRISIHRTEKNKIPIRHKKNSIFQCQNYYFFHWNEYWKIINGLTFYSKFLIWAHKTTIWFWPSFRKIKFILGALILDGNSKIGVLLRSDLGYLICLRHFFRTRAVTILSYFLEKPFFHL